ncbi:MAG: tetratricopeptide repeat protein [Desulfopila sp.]
MEHRQKQPYLIFVIIFLAGFVAGAVFAVYKLGVGEGQQPVAQVDQTSAAITNLEATVTANPEDYQSWIHLGHLYFDTNQYQKAIAAYTNSLKYHPGDANLLTDLGVMYRRTGQPEKAIEMFEKAKAMDPSHQPSRFNEGIVRFYDLKDTAGALACWEDLLTVNPDAATADGQKVKDLVEQIKAGTLKN